MRAHHARATVTTTKRGRCERRDRARTTPRARIYENILETVGDTPVIKVNRLAPAGIDMYVKCEYFNPLSSVKDRLAVAVITDAERRGLLKPGDTVVEATSGNTGIAGGNGVRSTRLQMRHLHGRAVFCGTSEDHAHARRESHRDAEGG